LILSLFDGVRHWFRRRRWSEQHANGARGEDLAMRYLQRKKFIVVARNYKPRSGHGEIDLVAWDGGKLVFVEVKSAVSDASGTPDRAVDAHKRENIQRVARAYCGQAKVEWGDVRFDVVTVLGTERPTLEHFPGAF
jgi:putative endonuclease